MRPMMDLDVVVLGTGLSESITAAALSKAGYKVAHTDANPYYGGGDASLTLDELVSWAEERSIPSSSASPSSAPRKDRISGVTYSEGVPSQSRQYAVSLEPTIIPSIGPLIDCLIASGVSRYGGFKLIERVAIFERAGIVKPVPGSKEDVFKNKQLSLLHKRRLMRFLMFAGGEFEGKPELQGHDETPFAEFLRDKFSLDEEAIQVIVYALAFCISASDPTVHALLRVRRYLRSSGRYGPSSFLVGHYGGLGEISQGFCRSSAVSGAVYILGHKVLSIEPVESSELTSRKYAIQLEGLPEQLYCDVVISSDTYAQQYPQIVEHVSRGQNGNYAVVRGVAVIDRPIRFCTAETSSEPEADIGGEGEPGTPTSSPEVDTAVLVFPPSSIAHGSTTSSVSVLITGEASMATPRGKWLLHLYMPLPASSDTAQTPESLLRPYLDATLTLLSRPSPNTDTSDEPLFSLFYRQRSAHALITTEATSKTPSDILIAEAYSPYFPEIADSAARQAESTFWRAVEALKAAGRVQQKMEDEEGAEGNARDVESFWPPLEHIEDAEDW